MPKFQYIISGTVKRSHLNIPFTDFHYHQFGVRLHLEVDRVGQYGIDMVLAEQQLTQWLESLPDPIDGTTEDLCEAAIAHFQPILPIAKVEVSETPERVTILCCCQ